MRFEKPVPPKQCSWVVKPGEYEIAVWDGKQCFEKNPYQLVKCHHCDNYFCLMKHWGDHLNDLQSMSEEETSQMP